MPSGLEATQCTEIFQKSATKKILEKAENRKYISKETDKKVNII